MTKAVVITLLLLIGVACVFVWLWSKSYMMDTLADSTRIVTTICSSLPKGHRYVVDEYRNNKKDLGGFISYSLFSEASLPVADYYDSSGKPISTAFPSTTLNNAATKSAAAWKAELSKNFPLVSTYDCDALKQSTQLTETQAIERVKNAFPEFADYNLAKDGGAKTISTQQSKDDWYVAFQIEGSGLPIVHADCFLVDANGAVSQTGTYSPVGPEVFRSTFSPRTCTFVKNDGQ